MLRQLIVYIYKLFVYRVYKVNLKILKVLNTVNKTYDNPMFYICFVYTSYICLGAKFIQLTLLTSPQILYIFLHRFEVLLSLKSSAY